MRHWQMDVTPDVLIMPSRLLPLAKNVKGSLVVNPGPLAKGTSGGTFAELTIHPMKEKDLRDAIIAGEQNLLHQVAERTKVVISKI